MRFPALLRSEIVPDGRGAALGLAAVGFTALTLAVLFSASCAVAPKPAPTPGAVPAGAPSGAKPCPAGTISLLNRGLGSVHSLQATLNMGISVQEPAFATRVQAGLVADGDSNFRLRAYLGPVCILDAAVVQDSVWAYFPGDASMFVGTVEEAIRSTPDSDMAYVLAAVNLRDVLFPAPFIPDSCRTSVVDRRTCEVKEHVTGPAVESGAGRPREIYPRPGGEPIPARLRFQPRVRERTATVETRKGRLSELHVLSNGGAVKGTGAGEETTGDVAASEIRQGAAASEVSAAYNDYRKTGRGVFPHKVAVDFPRLGVNLTLSFDRVEVNPEISTEAFHVGVSDGVTIFTFKQLGD